MFKLENKEFKSYREYHSYLEVFFDQDDWYEKYEVNDYKIKNGAVMTITDRKTKEMVSVSYERKYELKSGYWVTDKEMGLNKDFDSYNGALEYALELIEKWCLWNDFTYSLTHNTSTSRRQNANRVVSIGTPRAYQYKLIISSYCKEVPTGRFEKVVEPVDWFDYIVGNNEEMHEVEKEILEKKTQYYARLERV